MNLCTRLSLLKSTSVLRLQCQNRHTQYRNLLELRDKGFFQSIFPDTAAPLITEHFSTEQQCVYAGFDPTADSLHIGNLLVVMGLLHCQRSHHKPIAVLGGATALVGDPSGRKTERLRISNLRINHNLACIEAQLRRLFQNHQECFWPDNGRPLTEPIIVNNADWYKNVNLVDFIAEYGRHFRLGQMMSRSSVQSRLESQEGMSFTEFSYQLFQAYDWLHLLRTYNCRFQLGGTDQIGNIMTGHELITRAEGNKSDKSRVYGLTLPIVTNEEGDKFGKSAGNAIWLDGKKTSAYALYQFFYRIPDATVETLLKLFTFLTPTEIQNLMREHRAEPANCRAQTVLAEDVTLLVHGEKGLKSAQRITKALFKDDINAVENLSLTDITQAFNGAPQVEILPKPGMSVLQMAMEAKCFPTETDAMRIISAGGFYVNQQKAQNISEIISKGIHVLRNNMTLLRVGKRNYYIVRWLE